MPLIGPLSELGDGFEPHGLILQSGYRGVQSGTHARWGGVYPGCAAWVGTGRVVYRVQDPAIRLRLI